MNKLPLARSTGIVFQELGKEVLIYDLKTHKAYNLNETSAIVYNACDGETSFDQLKIKHKFTDDLIFLALDELKKENLIEDDKSLVSPFAGMSRRAAIRKVGLGSMIALPLISSLIAPTAAQAQSAIAVTCFGSCICFFPSGVPISATCSSNLCLQNCTCQVQVSRFGCPVDVNGNTTCFGNCITGAA